MISGQTCLIELASSQFDAYLRLEDEAGKVLAENDDLNEHTDDSRIIFTAPYRIVATSAGQHGTGAYTLSIRTFAMKKPSASDVGPK
jgi:hypothetical protein